MPKKIFLASAIFLSFFLLVASAKAISYTDNNITAYYTLDVDGTSRTGFNNLASNGSPSLHTTECYLNNCYSFSTTSDYFSATLNRNSAVVSVCGWFSKPSQPEKFAFLIGSCNSGSSMQLGDPFGDGGLACSGGSPGRWVGGEMEFNKFYYVCCVSDDSNMAIYVNGTLKNTGSYSMSSSNSFILGKCGVNRWDGRADEIEIYNASLTSAQILNLYNEYITPPTTTTTTSTTTTTIPTTTTTTIPLGYTGEILLASQPSNISVNTVPEATAIFQKIPNQLTAQNIKLTKISAYIVCFPSTNVGYGLVNGTNAYSDKIIYFNNQSVDTIDGYGSWVNFTLGSGINLKPSQNYTFFINSSSGCSGANFMAFYGISGCNDTTINNTCTKHGGNSAYVDGIGISDYSVSMGYKMYGFGLGNRCDAWQGLLLDKSQYLSCSVTPKCDKTFNYCDYYAVMSQQFCNETVINLYPTALNGGNIGSWCGANFWPYCKTGLTCIFGVCQSPSSVCNFGGVLSENRKYCYMPSNISSTGCMALSGQTLGFTNIKCGIDYDYIQNYGYKTVKCSDFNCTYYKDKGLNVSFITYQPVVNKTKVNGHCIENGTYTYFIYDLCSDSAYSLNKTDICKKSQVCINDIGCIGNTTAIDTIGEFPEGTNPIYKAIFSQQGIIIMLFSIALGIAYFFIEDEFIMIIIYSIGNFLLGLFGISFFGLLCSVLGLLTFLLTQNKIGGVQKSATS